MGFQQIIMLQSRKLLAILRSSHTRAEVAKSAEQSPNSTAAEFRTSACLWTLPRDFGPASDAVKIFGCKNRAAIDQT